MKLKTAVAAAFAAIAVPVLAQTAAPRLDQRQANQEARIQQGVQSGALTAKEAERLEKGQEHVQKIEDKAKADGKVTARERERLHQAEEVQSRHIAREKHDRQRDMNHDGRNDRQERRAGKGPGQDRGKHLGQKKH